MNKYRWILTVGMACTAALAQQPADAKKAPAAAPAPASAASSKYQTQTQKYSYIHGVNLGRDFRRKEIQSDTDALLQGFRDALAGDDKIAFKDDEMNEIYRATQKEYRARYEEKRKASGEKAAKDGAAFLAENAKKPGVKSTASGLQYKVATEGSGESPKTNDTVQVHYRGTLVDGTEFDSSYKRGQPAKFPVNGVIKGWTEALTLMKPGAKWQLYIPGALAYGERGSGDRIPPNSTLIFDVELLSVTPAAPTPPLPAGAAAGAASGQAVTSDIIRVPSAEELKKGAKVEVIKPEDLEKEKAKQNKK